MGEPAPRTFDVVSGRRSSKSREPAARSCPSCGGRFPLDFVVCPRDATSLEVLGGDEDPLIGEVVAQTFMLTGLLGEGGMGRVYQAEHLRLPKRFAVKVMLEHIASHPEAVARFEREAQAVARIVHDHVVSVVDVARLQGRPCMVTELLEGSELGDVLECTPRLPLRKAITVARQVCGALAAAHAASVVHRDLKPSNLFLLRRDNDQVFVKILDFGIAKVADGAQLTRTGMVLGTPAYMAPEQALGSSSVDGRVDLYAVGALLYRMLTGVTPFPEDDPALTLTRLVSGEAPRRPREIDPSIPEGVEAVILRAMARAPEDRPESATELERMLAAAETPPQALPPAPEPASPPALSPAAWDRVAMAAAPTLAVAIPTSTANQPPRNRAWAHPGVLVLAILFSLLAGGAIFVGSATALQWLVGPVEFAQTEPATIALPAAVATGLLLLGALRALISTWWKGAILERLRDGIASAVLWLLIPMAVLGLGLRGYSLFFKPALAPWAQPVEIGALLGPVLLGATAFSRAVWRARRSATRS